MAKRFMGWSSVAAQVKAVGAANELAYHGCSRTPAGVPWLFQEFKDVQYVSARFYFIRKQKEKHVPPTQGEKVQNRSGPQGPWAQEPMGRWAMGPWAQGPWANFFPWPTQVWEVKVDSDICMRTPRTGSKRALDPVSWTQVSTGLGFAD